jgi:oxygen-dependent protoporphyrinogen oxidase
MATRAPRSKTPPAVSPITEQVDVVVVGAGLSGLTAAWRILQQAPGTSVRVLEAAPAVGGAARTDRVEGFLFDRGANGFLTNVLSTWELSHEVGIGDELVEASDLSALRFLYGDGQLQALPLGPEQFAKSALLSAAGKARILAEPLIPRRTDGYDESVLEFTGRRLGPEAARVFMPALVTGIVGGAAADISLQALFPRMKAMELEHGSLIRAGIAAGRARRKAPPRADGRKAPSGRLTSFRNAGMGRLAERLGELMAEHIRLQHVVSSIKKVSNGVSHWEITTPQAVISCKALVVATPAHAAASLLGDLDSALTTELQAVKFAGIRVLGLGFRRRVHPLNGFGFLVPRGQGVRTLGCLWSSAVFPDQAPTGFQHMRAMMGGAFDPDIMDMSDDEALELCMRELRTVMGIRYAPDVVHQVLWKNTIPQYHMGHLQRVARIDALLARHDGLTLAGNSWRGVGINDCVNDGNRAALRAVATIRGQR